MKFQEFENIMSPTRMSRYKFACNGNTKKAMTLYRYNLHLSQELFTVISCVEIALRNAINIHYSQIHGHDWLRDSVNIGGMFDTQNCRRTRSLIQQDINKLGQNYTHPKLIAEMDFGFWRYLFAQPQYFASGQSLLQIFPAKPRSTPTIQYNQTYVFNQLGLINDIRNRIAHHEPICFLAGQPVKNTTFARQHYAQILQLFQWMSVDEAALLYGLDHINRLCNQIDIL
jgi:Abi-like protein